MPTSKLDPRPDPEARYWRLPAVLRYVQRSRTSLYRDIAAGTFPAPVKLGPNTSAWIREEVEGWAADREAEPRQGAAA